MMNEVMEHEIDIFTDKEYEFLVKLETLSCQSTRSLFVVLFDLTLTVPDAARLILVRLLLRKQQWQPLSSLSKCRSELGDVEFFKGAKVLCKLLLPPDFEVKQEDVKEEEEGVEIIDLTLDSDDEEEDIKPSLSSLSSSQTLSSGDVSLDDFGSPEDDKTFVCDERLSVEPDFDYFCEDETTMTLQEALERLSVDQLKELVKATKTKPFKNTVRSHTIPNHRNG